MKKFFIIGCILAALIFIVTMSFIVYRDNHPRKRDIPDVEYIDGYHSSVDREGEYIIYEEYIELQNNTDNDLYGYVIADITKEFRLAEEGFVYAYDPETGEKLLICIPANEIIELDYAYFKVKRIEGSTVLRMDREPLADVIFEEVNMD